MFADTKAFSGFAVDDIEKARQFYAETLGLRTSEEHGLMTMHLAGDRPTLVYPKPDHQPATYTILNFEVDDIDAAVDELTARRSTRALRGARVGRAGDHAERGSVDRVVQRSGGQRALRAPAAIARRAITSVSRVFRIPRLTTFSYTCTMNVCTRSRPLVASLRR
jgi:catechol 2,3-dioxygenase-like lactoylglutathione lyase family enzyme